MAIEHMVDKRYQKYRPVLKVPVDSAVPSTLHIFLGIVPDFLKKLEELAVEVDPEIIERMENVCRRHRINKRNNFQKFNGLSPICWLINIKFI